MIDTHLSGSLITKLPTCPKQMAVFPLPLFILPNGIQRLRIFEPRYLSMIAEAGERGGFVIARYDNELAFNVPNWGTRVEVIDFHAGKDGILVADVKAIHLVSLDNMVYRNDNLLLADTCYKSHWDRLSSDSSSMALGRLLEQLFEDNDALAQLYGTTHFDRLDWVCARFLEILPLSLNEKEKFIHPSSFEQLTVFLHSVIFGNENIN